MNKHYTHIRNSLIALILFGYSCSNVDNDQKIDYPPGGYEFSQNVTNTDFYHYPLIGKISRKDSFNIAYWDGDFFGLYNVPNISLSPSANSIFRLYYRGRVSSFIITLSEDEIIIKSSKDYFWPEVDTDKLTQSEQKHFRMLHYRFPLDEAKPGDTIPPPPPPPELVEEYAQAQKSYDSTLANTPELLDPKYYDYLLEKAAVRRKEKFNVSTKRIKITKVEFKRVVDLINESGYWQMDYEAEHCGSMDATSFTLEANNGKKYNAVSTEHCFDENLKYGQACYALIKMAKLAMADFY